MPKGKLFIIDMMPFLYRGHFAFLKSPRITSTGINTSALLSLVNGLGSIISAHSPTHVAIAMDCQCPTFRHAAFPQYKANREKMPEDIAASIPYAFELADALNIPVLRMEGYEADDIMGSLAVRAAAEGYETYCATPDKDAAQLVSPMIRLFRPGRGKDGNPEIYGEAEVKEHWSLSDPRQMIDLLALAGDAADNIPGIRGIGEKTAMKLLAEYGSVEGILAHAGELKGKIAENVSAGADDARMSKFLATIKTDVPVDAGIESFAVRPPDAAKLAAVCAKFELSRLAKAFGMEELARESAAAGQALKTLADIPHDYRLVSGREDALALAAELEKSPLVGFDTETSSADPRTALLAGISFATAPGKAWYVAVPRHDAEDAAPPDDLFAAIAAPDGGKVSFGEAKTFVSSFARVFEDPARTLVAHNAKFDIAILSRYGIRFGSTVRDTMLEHYILDAAARHSKETLARECLGYEPIPIESLIGEKARGKEQLSMADLPPERIRDYAAQDADLALRWDAVLRPKVAEAGAMRALEESEEPLVPILLEMEREGVAVDSAALRKCGEALDREIEEHVSGILACGGPGLNVDSPKQLGHLLFETLGIDAAGVKRTAGGQYATDEKTLQKIAGAHPVVKHILEYRACAKLKSTYVEGLRRHLEESRDGRVHTTFTQAFAETGRLSSANPNLQNIPVRTSRGKLIRAAIVPRDSGHVLVSADYSQIELRILAAMSGDESMLAAFARGDDVHRDTASRVYGIPPEQVTPEQRAGCKMVNFGIVYGISAFGLSQRLGIPRHDAADLIGAYFRMYPKIRVFMDKAVEDARRTGYAATALGRRRTLRDISSRNATARQAAERDAMNTPIQGTAADLIKLAMVRVDRALKRERLAAKMVLQIHDELLFDVPRDEAEAVAAIAKREMSSAMDLGVPLEVSVGTGDNWLAAH